MSDKKIQVFENFLPEALYRECNDYSLNAYVSGDHAFKTNYHWHPYMVQDSAPVLIHDMKEGELYEKVRDHVEGVTGRKIAKWWMFYYWTRYSFSPWHNDDNHHGGMTIYLNDHWDPNWGGAFLWHEAEEIKALYPSPNRAVLQTGGIAHTVIPVTFAGNVRRTIQLFLD